MKDFFQYFKRTYTNRPELWAYCHRKNAGINTNMHLEAMHKMLKQIFLEGKKNYHIDKLISALIGMTSYFIRKRLFEACKGQVGSKIATLHKNHSAPDISVDEDDQWKVKSQSTRGVVYDVSRTEGECTGCHIRCDVCKACVHSFRCTCLDYFLRINMCKHIHAV
ncbi:unnamed protein product, partial [Ixodes hexagonus]